MAKRLYCVGRKARRQLSFVWDRAIRQARLQTLLWFGCGAMLAFSLPCQTTAAGPVQPSMAPAVTLELNGNLTGRTFQGIGGLSAGASSRLLYDYPRRQRRAVLNYLFKPHFGAGYQILKVEIGGDVDSTDGSEPSFARTPSEFTHPKASYFHRGYEWWLMREARKINPHIKLWVLQWGAPYWVGHQTLYTRKNAEYVCRFIQGAWKYYHLRINYCGLWNERLYSVAYVKLLRRTLDANGLSRVKIVAADDGGNDAWSLAAHMLKDPVLMKAVYALGAHYPLTWGPINRTFAADAVKTGKPLWASEDYSQPGGWKHAKFLVHEFLENHLEFHTCSETIWPLIGSWYPALPCGGQGPMLARTPWSGHYDVEPAIWALAHFGQFVPVGWKYLRGNACGKLPAGGDYCTFRAPVSGNYSLIAETSAASVPQTLTVHLSGKLSNGNVYVWQSTRKSQFVMVGKITPTGGTFTVTLRPHAIYTLTTTTGQKKGRAFNPPAKPFPLPYADNFQKDPIGRSPKYFSDQHDAFAIEPDGKDAKRCLRQRITHRGIAWMPGQGPPLTLIGSTKWRNYQVSVKVQIPPKSYASLLGRVAASGWHAHVHGYRFNLHSNGHWTLWSNTNPVARGVVRLASRPWHTLVLRFSGPQTVAIVDGQILVTHVSLLRMNGMAGLGSSWNHVEFRDFAVIPIAGRNVVLKNLALHAQASASSIWSNAYDANKAVDGQAGTRWNSAPGTAAGQWLQIRLAKSSLCNVVLIRQFAGRIINCRLEASANGIKWRTIAKGHPNGKSAFELSFAPIAAKYLRVVIGSTVGNQPPSIREWCLYHVPQK